MLIMSVNSCLMLNILLSLNVKSELDFKPRLARIACQAESLIFLVLSLISHLCKIHIEP